MRKREIACLAVEMIGEAAIGATIAIMKNDIIDPKLGKTGKVITTLGAIPLSWMAGRAFGNMVTDFCGKAFGVDLGKHLM